MAYALITGQPKQQAEALAKKNDVLLVARSEGC
jgi:hypothetical protein